MPYYTPTSPQRPLSYVLKVAVVESFEWIHQFSSSRNLLTQYKVNFSNRQATRKLKEGKIVNFAKI